MVHLPKGVSWGMKARYPVKQVIRASWQIKEGGWCKDWNMIISALKLTAYDLYVLGLLTNCFQHCAWLTPGKHWCAFSVVGSFIKNRMYAFNDYLNAISLFFFFSPKMDSEREFLQLKSWEKLRGSGSLWACMLLWDQYYF